MRLPAHIQAVLAPVHRAGWPFVAAGLALALVGVLLADWLVAVALVLTAWIAYFFRDPARVTPDDEDVVVSPADGKILAVGPRVPPPELELGDAPRTCISVFLSVFDVHINRAPVSGRITTLAYRKGKFVNAALDKASEENERQTLGIATARGEVIGVALIAGLVARRIVRFVEAGQAVRAGERIALIRFGSRCDVYLPDGMTPLVLVGQRAVGGETVLADRLRNRPPGEGRRS